MWGCRRSYDVPSQAEPPRRKVFQGSPTHGVLMTCEKPTQQDSVTSCSVRWIATRGQRLALVAMICGAPFLSVVSTARAQNPPATEQGASPATPAGSTPTDQRTAAPSEASVPPTPSQAPSSTEPNPSVSGTALLPRDLSAWGMFLNAD